MENVDNMEVSVEHYIYLSSLRELGIDVGTEFIANGWSNFFRRNVYDYPEMIKQLWKTISIYGEEIKGTVLGGKVFCKLETGFWGRCAKETDSKSVLHWKIDSSKMTDQARIMHQVLNKLIFQKLDSKDYVSALHELLLVNLLSQRKITTKNG